MMLDYAPATYVPLNLIDDSDRLRPVEPAWAEVLAGHYRDRVPLPAILLRPPEEGEVLRPGCNFALVIGGHRVAGARLAGVEKLQAIIQPLTRAEARIREVDENLDRHELTALDRAIFLLERKRAWEVLHPTTKDGGDRKSQKFKEAIRSQTLRSDPASRFSSEVAAKIGRSERTVQAAIELASKLDREAISHLRGTSLVDNAAQLRDLAAEPAERQRTFVGLIAAGQAGTVREARIIAGEAPTGEGDPQEKAFRQLVAAWDKASRETRSRFIKLHGLREQA